MYVVGMLDDLGQSGEVGNVNVETISRHFTFTGERAYRIHITIQKVCLFEGPFSSNSL